jgi:hypothetical protein
MIKLRLLACTVLAATLAAGCASPPAATMRTGQSPEPAGDSPAATRATASISPVPSAPSPAAAVRLPTSGALAAG